MISVNCQISSSGWKIGWKITRSQTYLPALTMLIT